MTPESFDAATSREMVGDGRARRIETKARADADAGVFNPPAYRDGVSYWCAAQDEFARVTYAAQHGKRVKRLQRIEAV